MNRPTLLEAGLSTAAEWGALRRRMAAAAKFRMQNISAVLEGIGCPRISGYRPAENVSAGVTTQILVSLAGLDSSVLDLFQLLPAAARQPPVGEVAPQKNSVTAAAYQRGAAVVAWVLRRAAGHCECCGQPAPFIAKNGVPFLEVHHVQPLSGGGEDTPANTVAICPNCHREAHYGERAQEVGERLRQVLGAAQ